MEFLTGARKLFSVAFFSLTLDALAAGGSPGPDPFSPLAGLMNLGSSAPVLSYEGRFTPKQRGTPSLLENTLATSFPIHQQDGRTWSGSFTCANTHLSEPVILSSGTEVPDDYYRTEIGAQFARTLSGQRNWGLRGAIGFTGDEISSETRSFSMGTHYSFSNSPQSRWVLMLFMSNNSPLGAFIPVPGFLYIYRTSTFIGVFGLPIFSLQWMPVAPWSFSISAFGPLLRTEASYGTPDSAQFFAGLGWKQQRYLLSDRVLEEDRLTIDEKYGEVGARKSLYSGVFSAVQIGYSFARSIYVGDGLFNKDRGEARLEASAYAKASIRMTF